MLAEGYRYSQNLSFAFWGDTSRYQNSRIPYLAVFPHFFKPGVQKQIPHFTYWPLSPLLKVLVQLFCCSADLHGLDLKSSHFLDDGRDLSGGNNLNIHLCQGEQQSPFKTHPFLKRSRKKATLSHRGIPRVASPTRDLIVFGFAKGVLHNTHWHILDDLRFARTCRLEGIDLFLPS